MAQARVAMFLVSSIVLCGVPAFAQIALQPIGQHAGSASAEIAAYDPASRRVFSVDPLSKTIDVLDIVNPAAPFKQFSIDVSAYGTPNSVDTRDGIMAVAVESNVRTSPGRILFYEAGGTGDLVNWVTIGAVPDMVTFTPNGRWLLVANEGEPDVVTPIDPEGSVSIIDMTGGAADVTQADVRTAAFTKFTADPTEVTKILIDPDIRIFGPNNPSVAQDLEPEYIAVSHDSKTAWVTLQENNAIGILDIGSADFTNLVALGFKNHALPGNALDASDRDSAINIRNWPVFGMYLPDAIASFRVGGKTYLITANEGDSRDFPPTFTEEARVGGLTLDPIAFPNATTIKQNAQLGRLKVTNTLGDTDSDGDFDELYAFGARSISVWTAGGKLVFDSGDELEQKTAEVLPAVFNDQGDGVFDSRSDDKGPEPEGVVVGRAYGRQYAFVTLERIGGVMVYDLSDPTHPHLVQYINTRATGDRAPEGIIFVKAEDSPNGHPLVIVSHEVSGTTRIFQVNKQS
jgi:Choice-of-anchor I domain